MAILNVMEWPAKVLETRANEVAVFDGELRQFVSDMFDTMEKAGGIGLAANQVDRLVRVLVIHISSKNEEPEDIRDWHDKKFVFINPTITRKQGKTKYLEGCLSFPEQYDYVDRAAEVTLVYKDEWGKEHSLEADGLFAICLQHELDHIDGVVFTSRMSRLKSSRIRKKMLQRSQISDMDEED